MTALSVSDASRKYHIPYTTLRGWIRAGLVHVEQAAGGPGMPLLVLESDVAKLARYYEPGPGGRGKVSKLRELVE